MLFEYFEYITLIILGNRATCINYIIYNTELAKLFQLATSLNIIQTLKYKMTFIFYAFCYFKLRLCISRMAKKQFCIFLVLTINRWFIRYDTYSCKVR